MNKEKVKKINDFIFQQYQKGQITLQEMEDLAIPPYEMNNSKTSQL